MIISFTGKCFLMLLGILILNYITNKENIICLILLMAKVR